MPNDVKPLGPDERRFYIESLESDGFRVLKDPPKQRARMKLIDPKPGGTVRVGVLSDTHLGSRTQQISHVRDFYKYADARGVQAFLHAGDIVDGLHVHRDAVYRQFAHGFDAQLGYAAKEYPLSQNGPTYFIEGNHDLWYYGNAGASAGLWLAEKRNDLIYLGDYEAFVDIGRLRMMLRHGMKGGGSYALSYKLQKMVEQMHPEERATTHVVLSGHYHSTCYIGRYQGVFAWMLGCFQARTRYERGPVAKHPQIAALVLEIEFTRDMKVWNIRPDEKYYEPLVGDYPGGEMERAA